jgi:hypothetical protein
MQINCLATTEQIPILPPKWFGDYNEINPLQGLKMRSPKKYRKSITTSSGFPV